MSDGGDEGPAETHPPTAGHGQPADDACSVQWDRDATSAYGTAARARFFVVVEQGGPWGRDAARQSHLDVEVGAELDARCASAGGRLLLIRRPGRHPASPPPHGYYLGYAGNGQIAAWLVGGHLSDPSALLRLDWSALAQGRRAPVAHSVPGATRAEPQLLVCTNGRRDVCCAVRGRPLVAAAHRLTPDRVWEVSHTGGHRFAPTAVLLPWGQGYARLDEQQVGRVLESSRTGQTPTELLGPRHDRGRSALDPAAQCAESHVRAAIRETRIESLSCGEPVPNGAGFTVPVAHVDGRGWLVHVDRATTGRSRPESCGKRAIDVVEYRGRIIDGLG